MQSLRDFDCTDSYLLEATADGAAACVGSAPPRWSFKVVEGPLHAAANRQKVALEQFEAGTLFILKPVDEVRLLSLPWLPFIEVGALSRLPRLLQHRFVLVAVIMVTVSLLLGDVPGLLRLQVCCPRGCDGCTATLSTSPQSQLTQ